MIWVHHIGGAMPPGVLRVGEKPSTSVPPAPPPSLHPAETPAPLTNSCDGTLSAPSGSARSQWLARLAASRQDSVSSDSVPGGLQNLGNTCYANAVVQCLATQFLPLDKGADAGVDGARTIRAELRRALAAVQSGLTTDLWGLRWLLSASFRVGVQHYAHEFLQALLNWLLDGTDDPWLQRTVQLSFGGQMCWDQQSCACPPTNVVDVGLELTVTVCEGDTLQTACDRYFVPEPTDVQCDCCGVGHAGTSHWTLAITALPPVLIIQLSRYMTASVVAVGESLCTNSWMQGTARQLQL
eukprot:2230800-Rhodomonas_salina.2